MSWVIGESCTYGLWVGYEERNNFLFSLANCFLCEDKVGKPSMVCVCA